jgi:c-di-GMP-binding flagellar brake protein YcgR
MTWFNSEKPQDRRKQQPAQDTLPPGVTEDRRTSQRREYFRVVYPLHASPEITNLKAKVIDISIKGLRFEINIQDATNAKLAIDSKLNMNIKFHDGQTMEVAGVIIRQLEDQFGKSTFVVIFDQQIKSEVINKEQAYLLKNFPDFCRQKFSF